MTTDDIQSDADARLIEFIGTDDASEVWLDLNAWLQADPAHRVAFARSARAWRLAEPILWASEPHAGREQFETLLQALEEERVRSVEEFTDT
jgi:ferric-dicitrate binding protein FerR (iron transport regulator)